MDERKLPWVLVVTNFLLTDQRMQRIAGSLQAHNMNCKLLGRFKNDEFLNAITPFGYALIKPLFNKGKLFYISYNMQVFFWLIRHKISGITANDTDVLLACCLASKVKRVPLYFDAHELFPDVPEVQNRPITRWIWRKVEQYCMPATAVRYTVSEGLANMYEKRYGYKFSVIRNMPLHNLPSKKADANLQTNYFLYQGAVNLGRGLEALIEIAPQLNMPILIAGDGDLLTTLKQVVKDRNLTEKVLFIGKVSPEKLKTLTAGATLGFNLLEPLGLSYYYSLANKFFDYVQNHVPQICIDFPAYRELNNVYAVASLVPNLQPKTLLRAINSALEPQNYKQMQINCTLAAKEWHWGNEEKNLINLYINV